MLVTEENTEYWIAVNKINLEPGFQFYFEGGLEMRDFESKELDRTFEKILFVETITDVPISSKSLTQAAHGMPKQSNTKNNIELEIPEGSTTIEQIFRDKDILNGKQVTVTGKVVKVNEGILKMNWIHIQDGTQNEGDFDLTVTTTEMFKVGDIVTFVGTVTKDKDYGHGYFYNVILEKAKSK